MATVVRQRSTWFWIAAFRDAAGRQHWCSTGEVLKSRALTVAQQYERVARGKGYRQRVRATFIHFYREHFNEDLPSASVATYAAQWLTQRKAETSPATYARYERTVQKFRAFLGADAERDLARITKTRIVEFRNAQGRKNAAKTASLDLKIVKMISGGSARKLSAPRPRRRRQNYQGSRGGQS